MQLQNKRKIKFFVYTSPWRDNAAGIKVMYFLAQALTEIGSDVSLVIVGSEEIRKYPDIPRHNPKRRIFHGNDVITVGIYSETITRNLIGADLAFKWVLNFPGVLGSEKAALKGDHIFGYGQAISEAIKKKINLKITTLFVPPFSLEELNEVQNSAQVENSCLFYAGKALDFNLIPIQVAGNNWIEIPRSGPRAPNRKELLAKLKSANHLHVFENTALIYEASFLNCFVYLHPTILLEGVIGGEELELEGIEWFGNQNCRINRNINQKIKIDAYARAVKSFHVQTQELIKIAQEKSLKINKINGSKTRVPKKRIHQIHLMWDKKGKFSIVHIFKKLIN